MENYIERLKQTRDRKEFLSGREMAEQISAVQYLVGAARTKLEVNKTLRNPQENLLGIKVWDGYFFNRSIAIEITLADSTDVSVGLHGSLFVNLIDMENSNDPENEIVSLLTAKSPGDVGEDEALWLSHYAPENIRLMGSLILGSEPVSVEEFDQKTQAAFS